MADKIFVNGIISKEVPATAPDFILGKFSIQPNELTNWIIKNRMLEDGNGFINCTVLRSKSTGKRYVEVDQWKPTKKIDDGSVGLPPSELRDLEAFHSGAVIRVDDGHPM
jgi:hypothetical protein